MFSKACEHGIKAVIYIATRSLEGKRVKIDDVAENTGTPEAYTGKVLGLLTRHNIVQSLTGPYGGFEMDVNKIKQIKVIDIVRAIDGDSVYSDCALGLSSCDEADPCPMHDKFSGWRGGFKKMLETTTVAALATKLQSGQTTLIR